MEKQLVETGRDVKPFRAKRQSETRPRVVMMLSLVGEEGLEPSQPCGHRLLKPTCLPFHHSPKILNSGVFHSGALRRTTPAFNFAARPSAKLEHSSSRCYLCSALA